MRQARLVLAAALLLVAAIPHGAAVAQTDTASAERAFVGKINALRASKGLPALTVDDELTGIGRRWAGVMAEADRIYHNPNLSQEVTANWQKLGENVGVGGSVDSLHEAFVKSAAHYKNLVDPEFTHIGVGVVTGRDGVLFTSHQFMRLAARAPAPAPPAAAPAPAVTTTTAAARAAPPPTTRGPRPTTTQAPRPVKAAPEPSPAPQPAAAPETPAAPPAAPKLRPPRGVLVLDLLRALDSVH